MIYATRHANAGVIAENATIRAFEKREHAEAWLLAGTVEALHPRIATGRFNGCWRSTDKPMTPMQAEQLCAPFTLDQLEVAKPEAGNGETFTPTPDVLVLVDGEAP